MFLSDRTLTSFARRAVWAGVLLAVVLLPTQSGCVERRMTIRTNPPGALVYVDDYEIGATPVSTDFTYYGTRKIRIVKDGYETLTVMQPFPAPWYQYPPADFITENFVPGKIRDQRILDYQLKPQMVVPTDQLLYRAESLRHNNLVVPAGATMSRPDGSVPNQQPMAPNALPGILPGIPPNSNQYSPPNISVSPGAYVQPNAYPQPNVNQPTGGIGGQQVYPLPPR
ncbi:MAG: PEGA domain-containing protein [Thermoguttaceae bacterium]|jgi:hypothetical protein